MLSTTKSLLISFVVGLIVYGECSHGEGFTRASFPQGFVFGTASSAYQVEGATKKYGRGPSIWDIFIQTPGRIKENGTADVSVDEYHRYKEDIDLMVKLNMDAYRFSISWSRIFPRGKGKLNHEGVEYYNRLINYLVARGIEPYANLNHYDLPEALEEENGGWLSVKTVENFANYADFCFKTYGDRVKRWTTFNEPRDVALLGYDNGIFAPGRCSFPNGNCSQGNSATEPYIVGHNLLLAHAAAVKVYREKYQAEQKGKIGILLDFAWHEPFTNSSKDVAASHRANEFFLGWYLEPIINGSYPQSMQENVGTRLPKFSDSQVSLVQGSADFIGINHYTSYYARDASDVQSSSKGFYSDWKLQTLTERDGVPIGVRAHSTWLYIVPWGIYKAMTYIKERYGNPNIILSENGMDDAGNLTMTESLHDTTRTGYYKSYLHNLLKAVREGANVHGYFAWSLLDNFEWLSGYTSRFGLVYVDFKHKSLRRTPKASALWFKEFLRK